MENFEKKLGNFMPNFIRINTEHSSQKCAAHASCEKPEKYIFIFKRVSYSCGLTLNFLKEYKPRSCDTLRLIDACDRTCINQPQSNSP